MAKRSYNEIMNLVFKRLSNYSFCAGMKRIRDQVRSDSKGKIITPKLTSEKGWVTREHIEWANNPPYAHPDKHRYKYLNHEFIEKNTLSYFVKKPGNKNRLLYHEAVYRLRRTKRVYGAIGDILDGYWEITEYYESLKDHFGEEDSQRSAAQGLLMYAGMIRTLLGDKKIKGKNYPKDKPIFDLIFRGLQEIEKEFRESDEWKEIQKNETKELGTQDKTAPAGI